MNRFALAAVLFAVAPFAAADDAAAKKELKSLAGTWKVESATIEGVDQTAVFAAATLTLGEDGKYSVAFGGMTDTGTVTADPGKTPKQMDVTGTDGPNKGKTYLCLYELKGDTLTVCYGLEDKTRPGKLESAKGVKTMLIVYKKAKK